MPPVGKIAQLPDEIREWLHKAFVARGFGDIEEITAELNALMKEAGVAISIGKSAVGVESQRFRRSQEALRKTTEVMKSFAENTRDDYDARGEALNAKISADMFECLHDAMEAESMEDPVDRLAMLGKASLAAARLTTTSVRQRKFRAEVETKAKAAAESVAKIARSGGLTADQVSEIRSQILGITKRAA